MCFSSLTSLCAAVLSWPNFEKFWHYAKCLESTLWKTWNWQTHHNLIICINIIDLKGKSKLNIFWDFIILKAYAMELDIKLSKTLLFLQTRLSVHSCNCCTLSRWKSTSHQSLNLHFTAMLMDCSDFNLQLKGSSFKVKKISKFLRQIIHWKIVSITSLLHM